MQIAAQAGVNVTNQTPIDGLIDGFMADMGFEPVHASSELE